MGNGGTLLEGNADLIKSWRVSPFWVRENIRGYTSVHNLNIITGYGPSMEPVFSSGDPLLIDIGIRDALVDGLYFFRISEQGFIKQLQRIPTPGGVMLRAKSYNPSFDPFDFKPDDQFEVFGRVLTVWRSQQM
ncbi:MAG: hypothetical protein LBH10_01305 [Burkholderiaceae bacterium]|jgi:phage repressor protein C with HTH and peptisase S24 domain|nr:hypothetical protein [Burkholderiaceae bacterium]